jgi:hypothetical protein
MHQRMRSPAWLQYDVLRISLSINALYMMHSVVRECTIISHHHAYYVTSSYIMHYISCISACVRGREFAGGRLGRACIAAAIGAATARRHTLSLQGGLWQ